VRKKETGDLGGGARGQEGKRSREQRKKIGVVGGWARGQEGKQSCEMEAIIVSRKAAEATRRTKRQ